jgi:Zn-dependent protease
MESSIRLGRVLGIPFGVHVSWFLVFALVTWSLAAGYFPQEYPNLSVLAYALMGVATAVLFFGSVLAHELAHSLVAQREGIPVRSINLFIFGGVAQITREPKTAGGEFRITIAGPLTSLALALIFFLIFQLDQGVSYIAAPTIWLARINLSLALFNMIPGFPLDGGRVLRAVVWKLTGDFQAATKVATGAGQIVAFAFMAVGALSLFGGDFFSGLWLIFIGWFLQNAAASTAAQTGLEQRLGGATVEQAMARDCECIAGQTRLDEIVNQQVLSSGKRCFFVSDAGRLRGLLTLRDVARVGRDRWDDVTAEQTMVPLDQLVQVTPKTSLMAAMQMMDEANVAQIPVVYDEQIVGLLSRENILHFIRVRAELGL